MPRTRKCTYLIQPAYVPNEAPKAQRGEGTCLTTLGEVTVRGGSGRSLSLTSAPALSHPASLQIPNKASRDWCLDNLVFCLSALSPTSREKLLQLDRAREGVVRVMARVRARARVWIRMRSVAQGNRLTSAPNVIQFLFSPGLSKDHYSLHINNMNKIRRLEHKSTSSKGRANSLVICSLIASKPMCICYLWLCYLLSMSQTTSRCLK